MSPGCVGSALPSQHPQALVHAGDVERAEAELQRMLQQGFTPRVRAFNAVLHHRIDVAGTSPDEAAAAACIASTSALVTSMVDLGVQPDSHTYSGVLRTCQIVGEAELALAIYAELRARGLPPDASSLFTVLRTCHNRIRGAHDPRSLDRPEGKALLEALSADAAPARARGVKGARPSGARASRFGAGLAQLLDLPSWADRALAVYKDAVSHGLRPDMRSLGMMLSCMAVPKEDARSSDEDEIRVGAGPSPSAAVQEGYYDARVSHVLDDAVSSGLLPAFPISRGAVGDIEVDLREMMPVVAQVYALCFFQAIRRTLRRVAPPRRRRARFVGERAGFFDTRTTTASAPSEVLTPLRMRPGVLAA